MGIDTPDREQATAALREAEARTASVRAADTLGRRILLGWAALLVLAFPLFDILPRSTAGMVLGAVAGAGGALTAVHASRARVVGLGATRRYVLTWALWSAWYVVLVVGMATAGRGFALAGTSAGVLAALPLVAVAATDRRR